jgi:hypothetical protein
VTPILELLIGGFFSGIGWWSANHFVIDKYWDPKPEVTPVVIVQPKKEENKKEEPPMTLEPQQGP